MRLRSLRAPMVLSALVVALASLAAVRGNTDEGWLIEIGEERISRESFVLYLRQSYPGVEFERLPPLEQRRLVDEVVERKLFALGARESGLDRFDAVRARIAFFTDGVLAQEMKRALRRDSSVSDEQVLDYYRANEERFTLPPRVLLQHLIYPNREAATQARDTWSTGVSYEELASDRRSARGPIWVEQGWRGRELLLPELSSAAFGLEPGEVGEIVETSYGHHVLRVEAVEPERLRPLDEVRLEIEDLVRRGAAARLYDAAVDGLRERHPVRINMKQP